MLLEKANNEWPSLEFEMKSVVINLDMLGMKPIMNSECEVLLYLYIHCIGVQ